MRNDQTVNEAVGVFNIGSLMLDREMIIEVETPAISPARASQPWWCT